MQQNLNERSVRHEEYDKRFKQGRWQDDRPKLEQKFFLLGETI